MTKPKVSAFAARRNRQAEQQLKQQTSQALSDFTSENKSDIIANHGPTIERNPMLRAGPDTTDEIPGYYSDGTRKAVNIDVTHDLNTEQVAYNFKPNATNYVFQDGVLRVELGAGEAIVLQGQFHLKVDSGTIDVAGGRLGPSQEAIVIAPLTHALPRIEPAVEPEAGGDYTPTITSLSITSYENGLSDIGRICPIFKNIFCSNDNDDEPINTFTPLWALPSRPSTLELSPWRPALAAITRIFLESKFDSCPPPVILVTGSKSTGKSTFCRALVNSLITSSTSSSDSGIFQVGFLDIDPGQPIFTAPSVVSLRVLDNPMFAPPFACVTSHSISQRQHHIGYTSPKDDPDYYIACVLDLLQHYFTNYAGQGVPLVINTPGWTKGMGREILQQIVEECGGGITDIVALGHPDEASSFIADLAPERCGVLRSHIVAPASPQSGRVRRYTASDLRMLQTICYFHQSTQPTSAQIPACVGFDFSTHLVSQVPWVGSYSPQSSAAFSGITILDAEVSEDHLLKAILGTIVSIELVRKEDEGQHGMLARLRAKNSGVDSIPYVSPSESGSSTSDLLPPALTETVGLAILRNIDLQEKEIYFLTPIPAEQLAKWESQGCRIILVRGRAEIPVWLLWENTELHAKTKDANRAGRGDMVPEDLPFLSFDHGRTSRIKGGKEWRARKNLMRRSQARFSKESTEVNNDG